MKERANQHPRRLVTALAILLIAVVGLAGCGPSNSEPSAQSDNGDEPAERPSESEPAGDDQTNDANINVTEADSVPLSADELIGVWQTPTSDEQQQAFQYVFHRDETFAIYRANSDILAMNGDYRLDEDERELRLYVREAGSETLLSLQRLKPVAKREGGDQLIFKRMGEGDALWLGRTSKTPELQPPSDETSPPDN